MNRYDAKVYLNNQIFTHYPTLYGNHFDNGYRVNIEADETARIRRPFEIIASYSKEESKHILKLGLAIFSRTFDATGNPNCKFLEEWTTQMEFDERTLEGTCQLNLYDEFVDENSKEELVLGKNFFIEACEYLEHIWKFNPRVNEYMTRNLRAMSCSSYDTRVNSTSNGVKNYFFNVLRLSTTNLLEIEKLISSDNIEILKTLLNTKDATLDKSKKLSNVINIPKFALNYLKENNLIEASGSVKKIASEFDGNTLKIIFDFLESFNGFLKMTHIEDYNNRRGQKLTFFENCYTLLSNGYKITPLLNYLLRQRMYYDSRGTFDVPYAQAKLLVDYINLCKENNFNIEKLPQDLEKTHDITVKNSKVLKDSKIEEPFKQAIKDNYYIDPIEIGDFVFSVPKDVNDLVREGNELHHCIASYTEAIIQNASNIYFMRLKSNPEASFVTVELHPITHDVVEFKENYNKEPVEPEVIKAVKKFSKKIKKLNDPTIVVEEETETTEE